MVRTNPKIDGIEIFDIKHLLTSYADDTSFFVKNKNSVIEIFNDIFSKYASLKINKSEWEIARIGIQNGVKHSGQTLGSNLDTLTILMVSV